MTDIEILEEIPPEEFYDSIKRELVVVDGQEAVQLTYRDGTIKFVRNHAVPTKTLAGEKFEEQNDA